MSRWLAAAVPCALAVACGGSGEPRQEFDGAADFNLAVSEVVLDGRPLELDDRVECDFGQLTGRLVLQRELGGHRELGPGALLGIVVYADGTAPEFAMVECSEQSEDTVIKAYNGW